MFVMFLGLNVANAGCDGLLGVEVWSPGEVAPPDTLVVYLTPHQKMDAHLVRNGTEVPTVDHLLGVSPSEGVFVRALEPEAPLTEGETYEVREWTGRGPHTVARFSVAEQASSPAPPILESRRVSSEVTWFDLDCGGEWEAWSSVRYGVCNEGTLLALAVGAEPPASPLLEVGPDVRLAPGRSIYWGSSDALRAGTSETVWIGSFGPDGSFSGWVSDAVEVPEAGLAVAHRAGRPEEHAANDATPTTPPAPAGAVVCGEAEPWALESTSQCRGGEEGGIECEEVAIASPGSPVPEASSCASSRFGPGSGWPLAGLLAVLLGRRRGARAPLRR